MTSGEAGRYRQRRRTRGAIVEATMGLLADGRAPTISEIAEAADMSRRTVYLHFPTLEQLLIDATVGLISQHDIDSAIAAADPGGSDGKVRVEAMIRALSTVLVETNPLGRQLIRLTIEAPVRDGQPVRGYRRIGWIEQALAPIRELLDPADHERLVSGLSVIIGWEGDIVLTDVRGLSDSARVETMVWLSRVMIDASLEGARAR